jgi:hypothetical protein
MTFRLSDADDVVNLIAFGSGARGMHHHHNPALVCAQRL